MLFRRFSVVAFFLIAALAACSKDPIETYRAPKDPDASAAGELSWTVPDGWREQPAGGMRKAGFLAGPGADAAEVSVVALPGDAGGTLANVNRWRGQLGLGPLEEGALAAASRRVKSPAGELLVVDFSGQGKRTVAAILSSPRRTWFFKLTGAAGSVGPQAQAFGAFLASLRPHG